MRHVLWDHSNIGNMVCQGANTLWARHNLNEIKLRGNYTKKGSE